MARSWRYDPEDNLDERNVRRLRKEQKRARKERQKLERESYGIEPDTNHESENG